MVSKLIKCSLTKERQKVEPVNFKSAADIMVKSLLLVGLLSTEKDALQYT